MPWLSIIPPLVAVIGTFKTKKLIPSLFLGVVTGSIIGSHSLFGGLVAVGKYIVDALANKESLYTLGFIIAFGALADLIQMSGGISGFSEQIGKWVKTEKGVFVSTWLLSGITFFDTSFHIIGVGTIMRPLLEKVKGSKEKFAFLLSVTSL
ncbi:MAG: Na+/H+ antiporter NhaC family protein, partial [Dehalobacterium sp.]